MDGPTATKREQTEKIKREDDVKENKIQQWSVALERGSSRRERREKRGEKRERTNEAGRGVLRAASQTNLKRREECEVYASQSARDAGRWRRV